MIILKEISDKKQLLNTLKEISTREFNNLFVSIPPDLANLKLLIGEAHQNFRLIACLSGEYRFAYYNKGFRENVLSPDSLIMTLPLGGVLINKSRKKYKCFQIIFQNSFIRFLIIENNMTHWYHSGNPLQLCGQHILHSLSSMPLSKNFEKSRIKLCEALLDISLTELENDTPSKRGKAFNTYYSAFEFMRSNIHNKLNRETVAKACSITPSHLSKLFNRFAKEDFNQSLKRLRIEHSIFLLEKSSLSVNEIAFLCGFKTSAHFIRIFRQINSTSPGRFRNSNSRKTGLL